MKLCLSREIQGTVEGKLLFSEFFDHSITGTIFLSQLNAIYILNGECIEEYMEGEGSFNLPKSNVDSQKETELNKEPIINILS
jgi:hypothetical protein